MKLFIFPLIITILGILAAFHWGGLNALAVMLMLSTLEISLSFDNAVINAQILKRMNEKWQRIFLFWGILIAVFGVRIFLPLIIVSFIAKMGFFETIHLALLEPELYSQHLISAHYSISSFGGFFLLMVFLNFFIDDNRTVHWIKAIEKSFANWGKYKLIRSIIALIVLLLTQYFVPNAHQSEVILAGLSGIFLFVLLNSCIVFLTRKGSQSKHSNLINFLYLEVLDASFSFDGVISAFAMTKDIVVILLGLTLGAVFVRTLTLFLIHKNMLQKYIYLEHGAHYAVGALAILMLASLKVAIPEIVIGLVGVIFILLSLVTSFYKNKIKRN